MVLINNMATPIPTGFLDKITLPVDTTAPLNPTTGLNIGKIISELFPYIFWISGILILIYLIMGGFQLMFAAGEPKKVQGAWGKITNAIIGFVIIFVAYWVTQLIGTVFNIDAIKTLFG